jgi:hypothetical protein
MPEVPDGSEEAVDRATRVMPHAKLKHALMIESPARQLRRQADKRETPVLISQFGPAIRHQRPASRTLNLGMFVNKNIVAQDGPMHPSSESVAEVWLPAAKHADRNEELADYEALSVAEVRVHPPGARTTEILRMVDGKLRITEVMAGGRLSPKHFPGAVTEVSSIWPD